MSDEPIVLSRFLTKDGEIRQYPKNLDKRRQLLEWVASQALEPGEVLSEVALNNRLRPFSADVAVLRRYLVDFGLVERTLSGTEYALVAP